MKHEIQHYIGGIDYKSESEIEIVSPHDKTIIGNTFDADDKIVNLAVQTAADKFHSQEWYHMTASQRAEILFSIAERFHLHKQEFAYLESQNNGKPIRETVGEMDAVYKTLIYFAGMADKVCGKTYPTGKDKLYYSLKEPYGVVALITPWNSPLYMLSWKIAPALAAGNTVVLKPSEYTPITSVIFAKLCVEAGLPAGCLNIINGYGSTAGEKLVKHPGICKISYTGSIKNGRRVAMYAGQSGIPLNMELGGKAANIIFPDCDLDKAVGAAVKAAFGGQGHSCSAGSRIFLHKKIYDAFISRFLKIVSQIKIGDPLEPKTEYGPISNIRQYQKVLHYIEVGKQEGAKILYGGNTITTMGVSNGYYIEPTVFGEVTPQMKIAQEEIFGPIVSILPFEDEDNLIEAVNSVKYGLSGAVWSSNVTRVMKICSQMEMGTVWINCYKYITPMAPYGGVKASGYGRENGEEAINEYVKTKTICLDFDTMHIPWYECEKEIT